MRDEEIADMCHADGVEFAVDHILISERGGNDSYVLGWRWVDFAGTKFDMTTKQGQLLSEAKSVFEAMRKATMPPDDVRKYLDSCVETFGQREVR